MEAAAATFEDESGDSAWDPASRSMKDATVTAPVRIAVPNAARRLAALRKNGWGRVRTGS